MEDKDYETKVTVHLNYGPNSKDVEIDLETLTDEELRNFYDQGLEEAGYVLRERTGLFPGVDITNFTTEDVQWYVNWLKRHGEYEKYVEGNGSE